MKSQQIFLERQGDLRRSRLLRFRRAGVLEKKLNVLTNIAESKRFIFTTELLVLLVVFVGSAGAFFLATSTIEDFGGRGFWKKSLWFLLTLLRPKYVSSPLVGAPEQQ